MAERSGANDSAGAKKKNPLKSRQDGIHFSRQLRYNLALYCIIICIIVCIILYLSNKPREAVLYTVG